MYTDILKETKIIVIILRAVLVVTVVRTTIIAAWDIFLSIAMGMAAPILMSIKLLVSKLIAAVAMIMLTKKSIITTSMRMMNAVVGTSITIMSMKDMNGMSVAAGMSIIITGMRSMSTTNVAAGTSIITSMRILSIMCWDIPMTANVSFAIPMRSIATSAAKA